MTDPRHAALLHTAEKWSAAIVSNDVDRISQFVADDWVMVSDSGVSPRDEFMTAVASGALTHSAMQLITEPRVRFYGDTAIMTSRMTNTAHFDGKRFDADEWTTDVFVRENDEWVCVHTHITAATPPPPAD